MVSVNRSEISSDNEKTALDEGNQKAINKDLDRVPEYVVGIGASAGGLEALESLFMSMPLVTGMAYIVVQHLSPDYKSMMDQLLARKTMIPIKVAEDQMTICADTIYLLPPRKEMITANGKLLLTERENSESINLPINTFLRSLAESYEDRSIAIILSGTGSDGSKSVTFVHDKGGFVVAQTLDSCKFGSMPESAIATGNVDLVISPQNMPSALVKYSLRTRKMEEHLSIGVVDEEVGVYSEILVLLNNKFNLDFTQYKPSTITRRLERRLGYQKTDSLRSYIDILLTDSVELEALYFDLLIGVTEFFRDPVAFETLKNQIPILLEQYKDESEIRVWVAACSTGQEAYSLSMLMVDLMEKHPHGNKPLKIFATDVHSKSIQIASAGIYDEADIGKMDESYKKRFFTRLDTGQYQVVSEIRKPILFVQQNLLKDPPFTRTHIVSCRNLLIYFNTRSQERVLSLFTFSLMNKGLLFLGPSEAMGSHSSDYAPVDQSYRIYRKTRDTARPVGMPLTLQPKPRLESPFLDSAASINQNVSKSRKAQEILLQEYVPASVLINVDGAVLHVFGDAGDYLSINFGASSLNIASLVSGQAKTVILNMLRHVCKTKKASKTTGVKGFNKSDSTDILMRVLSDSPNDLNYIIISFTKSVDNKYDKKRSALEQKHAIDKIQEINSLGSNEREKELEEQLLYAQENLQSTIEELETSNEELQATNEELMSSNEELQSTNEELQSVNEELFTVNNEFLEKQNESNQQASDERSIIEGFNMGILFIDDQLQVRKHSPAAAKLFGLVDSDIGRPISTISSAMFEVIVDDIQGVYRTDKIIEKDVTDDDGTTYFLRIVPHRVNVEKIVDDHVFNLRTDSGVVVTFTNITKYRETQIALKKSQQRLQDTVDAIADGYFEWKYETEEAFLPHSFTEQLGYDNELPGIDVLLGERFEDFKSAMDRARKDGISIEVVLPMLTKNRNHHWVICKGCVVDSSDTKKEKFTGIILDFNDQQEIQSQLNRQATDLEQSNQLLVQFANIVSHDMRAPLRHIKGYLGFLEDAIDNDDKATMRKELECIYKSANNLDVLIDDIIMYSRVTSERKDISKVCLNDVVDSVIGTLSPIIDKNNVQVSRDDLPVINGDKNLLTHLFQNLIGNACKYTDKEIPKIKISYENTDEQCKISVEDNGIGFNLTYSEKMFDPFQRLVTKDDFEGTGIGLSICKTVVDQHNGKIEVTSALGVGSCFTVSLPRT